MGNETKDACARRGGRASTRYWAILFVLAVALTAPADAEAKGKKSRSRGGKIGKARSRSHRSHRSKKSRRSRGSRRSKGAKGSSGSGHRSNGSHGSPGHLRYSDNSVDLTVGHVLSGLLFPFTLPRFVLGDQNRPFDFYAYPYEEPGAGLQRMLPNAGLSQRPVLFRAMTSYQRESSNLDAKRIQLSLRTNWRLDFDVGLTRYTERLDDGRTDQMWQWKAMAAHSFAVSPRTRFSVGAGLRGFSFLGGERSTGFAVRYGAELYPVKPLRLWARAELGANSGALSGELDVGAGVMVNRVELFAGYRTVRFVGLNFGGPVVGVAAWF